MVVGGVRGEDRPGADDDSAHELGLNPLDLGSGRLMVQLSKSAHAPDLRNGLRRWISV